MNVLRHRFYLLLVLLALVATSRAVAAGNRTVSLDVSALLPGETKEFAVLLSSTGEENAVAFSLNYDPAALTFGGARTGGGVPDAALNVNALETAGGRVGLALALPIGARLNAGLVEVAKLSFTANSAANGPTTLTFGDAPVFREVADPLAETLPSSWVDASLHIGTLAVGITQQPRSVDGVEGDRVSLSVAADGAPPLSYQWSKNGQPIFGATAATLELPSLSESDAATYRVTVGNPSGQATSADAVVTYVPGIHVLVNGTPVTGLVSSPAPVTVQLRFGRADWTLRFTLDGSIPSFASEVYQTSFVVGQAADLRVAAYAPGLSDFRLSQPVNLRFSQPQTIAWGTLPNLRHPESVVLEVSASSGLPVALSVVSGPATLAGNRLTTTGAGEAVLHASQAGDAQFSPVSAERTLVIGKARQTLTWPPVAGRTFGDLPFGVAVLADSGLPVTVAVVAGKATIAGTVVTLIGAGTVTLSATQAGTADHEAVTETRSFPVAKAAQTISFPSVSDRGLTPGSFTPVATASSKLAVSFQVLSGPAQLLGGEVHLTGVGVVVLRADQPGDDDHLPAPPVDRTFTVLQAAQTITFTPVANRTFNDPPVTQAASSSSGLPVTFRVVSGPASVSGATLTLTGAGVVAVAVDQAGNANFLPAVSVTNTFTVSPATQTIAFASVGNRVFNDRPVTMAATSSSGLPVIFRLVSGPATLNGATLTLTGSGAIAIAADQAGNANYLPAPSLTNTFTIGPAAQAIAFAPVGDRTFNDPPVTLAASSSSGLQVTFRVVGGPATVNGATLTLTGAGAIAVAADQAGNANYLPAPSVTNIFTVGPASQVIAFAPVGNRTFNDPPATLAATSSSGLPVTFRVVGGPATVNGATLTLTGAGAIAVAADQAGNANFLPAVSVTNSFSIGKATQTITFAPVPDMDYTLDTVPLAATSSSGLPVTFRVLNGAAVVDGGTLKLTGVGSITVAADRAGNTDYLAAPSVTNRFTVGKGAQTISFPPIGKRTLDDPPVTLVATSSSGLPVTFRIVSGPATVSGAILTFTGAGNVVVQASQVGNDLFEAATASRTVVVAPGAPSPAITINRTQTPDGPAIALAWPTALVGAVLESAADPVTAPWTPVSITPAVEGDLSTVLVPFSEVTGYFRLKLP